MKCRSTNLTKSILCLKKPLYINPEMKSRPDFDVLEGLRYVKDSMLNKKQNKKKTLVGRAMKTEPLIF